MYRRVFRLLFFLGIFSAFAIFNTRLTNAQTCSGSGQCYTQQCSLKCTISGGSCDPVTNPCSSGQGSCQNFCTWLGGPNNCPGFSDSICNQATTYCPDSNGVFRSIPCFSSGGGTPAPTAPGATSPPAGGCTNGYCQTSAICTSEGGTTGSQGSCQAGTVQCCPAGGFVPPPGNNGYQGGAVFCKDGNNDPIPIPGVPVHLHQGCTNCINFYDTTTDNNGFYSFTGLVTTDQGTGNELTIPHVDFWYGSQQVQHPFATNSKYAGMKLQNGQLYSDLTPGDLRGSVFNSCESGAWTSVGGCGPGWPYSCGWYCSGSPAKTSAGYQSTVEYIFGIYTSANNGAFQFSNCTPKPSDPVPGCGSLPDLMGGYSQTFKTSTGVNFFSPLWAFQIDSENTDGSFVGRIPSSPTWRIYGNIAVGNAVTIHITNDITRVDGVGAVDATGNWTGTWTRALTTGTFTMTPTSCVSIPGCSCTGVVPTPTPTPPPAYWQVNGGDAVTNGNLQSLIPLGQVFNLNGASGLPGNNMFGSTILTPLTASSKGWLGNVAYKGKVYDSAYFNNIVPSNIIFNSLPAVTAQANLDTGTISPDGYYWYRKSNGTLNINGDITITGNRKVIVFVGGDAKINGKVKIQNPGQGFFMMIVTGNIGIGPSVTAATGPALEGIYEADGDFDMGGGTNTLYIRGTVVTYGNFVLNRQNGLATASETVEYAPDLIMNFPRSLIQDTFGWEEVVP